MRQRYLNQMGIECWVSKPAPYRIFLATDEQGILALVGVITSTSALLQQELWCKIVAVFQHVPGTMIETTYANIPYHCDKASRIIVLGDFISAALFNGSAILTSSLEDMVQNPSLKVPVWHAITRTFSPKK